MTAALVAGAISGVSIGCTRQQVADLILTGGFQCRAAARESSADEADRGWGAGRHELEPTYQRLIESLIELREFPAGRGRGMDDRRMDQLVERIAGLTEELARSGKVSQPQRQQAYEARLAALAIASDLAGDRYAAAWREYGQAKFATRFDEAAWGEASAARLLDHFLTAERLSPLAPGVLSLHAVTYPNCSLNVPLYSAFLDRLVNESQPCQAVRVAKDGVRFCSSRPDSAELQRMLMRLYEAHPALPGVPMQFSAPGLDGDTYRLGDRRGKVAVVTFWATWCPACREELNDWKRVQERFRSRSVEFVGISLDDDRPMLRAFLSRNGVTWPQVFISEPTQARWRNSLARQYGVDTIPRTFVVDGEGFIVANDVRGASELSGILQQLLADQER
jgi:peroxiredoxin